MFLYGGKFWWWSLRLEQRLRNRPLGRYPCPLHRLHSCHHIPSIGTRRGEAHASAVYGNQGSCHHTSAGLPCGWQHDDEHLLHPFGVPVHPRRQSPYGRCAHIAIDLHDCFRMFVQWLCNAEIRILSALVCCRQCFAGGWCRAHEYVFTSLLLLENSMISHDLLTRYYNSDNQLGYIEFCSLWIYGHHWLGSRCLPKCRYRCGISHCACVRDQQCRFSHDNRYVTRQNNGSRSSSGHASLT